MPGPIDYNAMIGGLLGLVQPAAQRFPQNKQGLLPTDLSEGGARAYGGGGRAPYSVAKTVRDSLDANMRAASEKLKAFDQYKISVGNASNLTPDHVRAMPEWQAAKQQFDQAFAALRNFNLDFTKTYKAEIAAERKARGR